VALLGEMPAESVDLSFWSPPYFVGKSYEKDWTFEDWQALLRDAIGAHFRVLKSAGFMVVNIGDILCFSDPDMPAFQANLRHGKKHRITRESYRAVDEFEHLFVFWKPGIVEVDRRRLSPKEWSAWGSRGVWRIPSVARNARHEAEFPEALAERVVRLYSAEGDVVLDPFCGSGTTAAVAKRHKRQYIGMEIGEQYAAMAARRVANAAP